MSKIEKLLTQHYVIIWNGYVVVEYSTKTRLKRLSDFTTIRQTLAWLGY